jgi:GntR family transcriptional regulator/MocR family aminotransferase
VPILQTSPTRELLVRLDRSAPAALHRQLAAAIREAVRARRLPPGAALPSTRGLARDLGVARSVMVEAYAQLAAEGYLQTRAGAAAVRRPWTVPAPRPTPRAP